MSTEIWITIISGIVTIVSGIISGIFSVLIKKIDATIIKPENTKTKASSKQSNIIKENSRKPFRNKKILFVFRITFVIAACVLLIVIAPYLKDALYPSPPSPPSLPSPPSSSPLPRYEVINQSVTWDTARKLCIEWGGDLAVINSHEKQEAVNQKIREFENNQKKKGKSCPLNYWIGGSREPTNIDFNDKVYYWVTGEQVGKSGFTYWAKEGEPDSEPSGTDKYNKSRTIIETRMMMFGGSDPTYAYNYRWNDENNNSEEVNKGKFAFIFEKNN